MAWTLAVMSCGAAVSRSTPKGRSVAAATAAICAAISSVPIVEAPRVPMPPALETAAANGA